MATPRQDRTNLRTLPEQITTLFPCEEWRPVVNFESYFVSNYGRVCSVDRVVKRQLVRGRVLRPGVAKRDGHWSVVLGIGNTRSVHFLVLTAFVGSCPEGLQGLHADDNPSHNWLSNLRWGTRSENLNDAFRNGKRDIGEDIKHAKLTDDSARYIRANPKLTLSALAQLFGVHTSTIDQVRKNITWKHVT